jgi:hypothetical protein
MSRFLGRRNLHDMNENIPLKHNFKSALTLKVTMKWYELTVYIGKRKNREEPDLTPRNANDVTRVRRCLAFGRLGVQEINER